MTVCDILIQTMTELTGEPEKAIASFIKDWKKQAPNKILDQEVTPQEADALRASLREGAEGPIANLVQETMSAFRLTKRDSQDTP